MSKLTTAIKSTAVETIKPSLVSAVVRAFAESDQVHVRRVKAIGALSETGLSVSGITDAVTVATGGNLPTGFARASVGRYVMVYRAIKREDVAAVSGTSDANAALVAGFVRLAGPGGGAKEVAAAADIVGKASGSAAAVDAMAAQVAAFNARLSQQAQALPQRPTGGETANGGKAPAEVETAAPVKATTPAASNALAGATVLSLISELTKRIGARAFSPDAVVEEAFTALALAWEEATATAEALAE